MDAGALIAGLVAVITGAAGVLLVLREIRRREHNAARREVTEMVTEFYKLDNSYIDLRLHCFRLRQQLADLGVEVPPSPAPALHEPLPREKLLS